MKVWRVLAQSLIGLAIGLSFRTVLFTCLLPSCFHSYDCARDEYREFFNFGAHVVDLPAVVSGSYIFAVVGLMAGLMSTWLKPVAIPWLSPRRMAGCALLVVVAAELSFRLVLFWLAWVSHFTTGDVFGPGGVC